MIFVISLKNPLGNLISDNDPNKENIIKKISELK